jgi:hypothetical protein
MTRILKTDPFPDPQPPTDVQVITPHPSAAARLTVPYISLSRIALEKLRGSGFKVAPPRVARNLLRSVIARTFIGLDASALAGRMRGSLDVVLRTDIDEAKLTQSDSRNARQLGIIAKQYRTALRQERYVDEAELLAFAAASGEFEPRPLYIYGYHRPRREEILFIDKAAGEGSTLFLPCSDDAIFDSTRYWIGILEERGWSIDRSHSRDQDHIGQLAAAQFVSRAEGENPAVEACAYPDIDAEVRATLGAVKRLVIDGEDPYSIAVVCRDPALYARTCNVVAAEYCLPIRIEHQVPIAATDLGGFIRLFIDAFLSDLPFESTVRMAMHPLGPGLERSKLQAARKVRISGRESWETVWPDLRQIHFEGSAPVSTWVAWLMDAFKLLGVTDRAAHRTREIIALNHLVEALRAVVPIETREIDLEAFAAILSEVMSEETVPMRPGSAGVTLTQPKRLIAADFDHLFVMGMAEGIFPQPPREDPVIDFFERKRLAHQGVDFAGAAELARWEDLSMYLALLSARKSIHCSYPRVVNNGETIESSFFKRLGVNVTEASGLPPHPSGKEEERTMILRHADVATEDGSLAFARKQYVVEERRERAPNFDEFDGIIDIPYDPSRRTWSASQLTSIGQCSFRWFSQRLLRLQPVEELEIGLTPQVLGKLFHKTLEIAVSRSKGEENIRFATLDQLEAAFAEVELDEELGVTLLPNWSAERVDLLRKLRKAIEAPDFIAYGAAVLETEKEFRTEWMGFPLTGTIDRIDATQGGLIAVDYKTGGRVPRGAKDRSGKLTVDVQLPLYADVALPQMYPHGQFGNSVYYSIFKAKILRSVKNDDMDKLQLLAEDIHSILAAGSFAVDPDESEKSCTYCDFDSVCRKGPRIRRKSRP